MKQVFRYLIAGGFGLVVVIGALKMLPNSAGKTSSGHGAGDEHGHGEQVVTMSDAKAAAAGIGLATAGPGVLQSTLTLNGILQANQETLVQITSRFPGVIRELRKRIGDRVDKDEVLGMVESNQSLRTFELRAPIAGTVTDRGASLGEFVSEQKPVFVIADLTTVWADFSVYRRDISKIRIGNKIIIDPEDGGSPIESTIAYISPLGSTDTQSALARAVVANADGRLRPGLFVTGKVLLTEKPSPLTIKMSALQTLENRPVIFVRNADKFEPRDVELGENDGENIEVLFGVAEGDVYAAKNSFVIKAELAKGSAAHDH